LREDEHRMNVLSTLWIFVVANYIYADILMLILNPSIYQQAAGKMSVATILAFSALMELPISMILLARVLPYRINRWANIAVGIESTLFQGATLFGHPRAYYVFFSIIEISCTVFITWYAFSWRQTPEF
jgi:uncharacterized protein DUF6326